MTTPILQLSNVRFKWPGEAKFSLDIPDFKVDTDETVLLLGQSGSGKSSLLSLICGTVTAQSGTVMLDGQDLSSMPASARDKLRGDKIGVIFQQFNLLPFASVLDNILLPLQFSLARRSRTDNPKATVEKLINALGIPSNLLHSKANQLSVGQQQRVAAARALIGSPSLIVADEPTSALDRTSQNAFLSLLFAQGKENGASLLMVSHDERLAAHFDRTVQMDDILSQTETAA